MKAPVPVRIRFSDGAYSYERGHGPACRCGERHEHEVEVPDEVVGSRDNISELYEIMQRQLRDLDNAWYERQAEIEDRCARDGHVREMDGTCHYCGVQVPE
jgi:hypothetical protein